MNVADIMNLTNSKTLMESLDSPKLKANPDLYFAVIRKLQMSMSPSKYVIAGDIELSKVRHYGM